MRSKKNSLGGWMKAAIVVSLALGLAGPAVAATAPDAWVTTKIKMALMTDENVSARDVNVDTVDGRVTLHGAVSTAAEKTRAEQVARKIDGVREVRNLLQVVPKKAMERVKISDDQLKQRVDKALDSDSALDDSSIGVQSVTNGVVLLGGKAKTLSDAYRAVEDAARVEGVVRVASEIESPDELADEELWREGDYDAAAYSTSTARDRWITTETKLRLMANTDTPAFDINVDTRDGIVTLFGMVDSQLAKDQATAEARKVGGVRQVVNDLQIVKSDAKTVARNDGQIEEAIEDSIEARPTLSGDKIEVEVKAGVARLSGTVESRSDQVTAITVARSTAGVKRVIDDLRLETPPVSLR